MSDDNVSLKSFTGPGGLQKELLKSMYQVMMDLMDIPEPEILDWLHLIVDAVNELIIEHSQSFSVVDLGTVQPDLFNGKSETTDTSGDIAGDRRESFNGGENEIREIDPGISSSE